MVAKKILEGNKLPGFLAGAYNVQIPPPQAEEASHMANVQRELDCLSPRDWDENKKIKMAWNGGSHTVPCLGMIC